MLGAGDEQYGITLLHLIVFGAIRHAAPTISSAGHDLRDDASRATQRQSMIRRGAAFHELTCGRDIMPACRVLAGDELKLARAWQAMACPRLVRRSDDVLKHQRFVGAA